MEKEPFSFKEMGLFSSPAPASSIMQMKILEEECMRHFPLMDAKERALYVSESIEQANNKKTDHD